MDLSIAFLCKNDFEAIILTIHRWYINQMNICPISTFYTSFLAFPIFRIFEPKKVYNLYDKVNFLVQTLQSSDTIVLNSCLPVRNVKNTLSQNLNSQFHRCFVKNSKASDGSRQWKSDLPWYGRFLRCLYYRYGHTSCRVFKRRVQN